MLVTKTEVLFRRLILRSARLDARSDSSSSSSRDRFELELRWEADEVDELRSRSVLMTWAKIVSKWILEHSRKVCSSSAETVGRACWMMLSGSVL
jgi:hypothetical protein